ncbi:MAG: three-Cys-motif partner protein TcmP, partial [Chloroflexota bacterium]|nr:three-Cys-motif partner protein TcmP [Chloroflexota bacterium]
VNWRRYRAVVFLDRYGMSVNWDTVATLGRTGAIDLWVLLPLGQAINRMLPREGLPMTAWGDRLTDFFGTDRWLEKFYHPSAQPSLFDDETRLEKQASFESIGAFFSERLKTAFPEVADNSLMLMNSRNVPIFALYFAASNSTAVRIANHILRG